MGPVPARHLDRCAQQDADKERVTPDASPSGVAVSVTAPGRFALQVREGRGRWLEPVLTFVRHLVQAAASV